MHSRTKPWRIVAQRQRGAMNAGGDPRDAETKATAFGMMAGIPGPVSATTSVTPLSAHESIRRLAAIPLRGSGS
ncbi:MAG: hypothetical protein EOO77_06015 [Oxalobacteraceae bacterium]|nr:MAG: hypothetical protein EOO77_06015 [Oxalobacteraceae bacterium]